MATSTRLGYDDLAGLLDAPDGGDEKHAPSAFSTLDVLWVLYDRVLRVDPRGAGRSGARPVPALQGPRAGRVLRGARGEGLRPDRLAARLRRPATRRSGTTPTGCWCPASRSPAARSGTGCRSPSASRSASAQPARHGPRVFVLVGDAELDEGSNHEAIALRRAGSASDRLTAVVVDNRSATHGWPGGIAARFAVEGWTARDRRRPRPRRARGRRSPPADGATARTSSSPRSRRIVMTMRRALLRTSPRALLDEDPRAAVVLADIGAGSSRRAGTRPRAQRRHPRAADDRRRRRPGARRAAADRRTPTRRSSSSGRSSRSSSTSATRASARCWSAPARPTTARRRAAPTSRPATWRCSTRCPAGRSTCPGHPDEVERCCARGDRRRRPRLHAAVGPGRTHGAVDGRRPGASCAPGASGAPLVVAVGPMLDPVLAATADLDVDRRVHVDASAPSTPPALRAALRRRRTSSSSSRTWPAPRRRAVAEALADRPAPPARPRRRHAGAAPLRHRRRAPRRARPRRGRDPALDRGVPGRQPPPWVGDYPHPLPATISA